MCPRPHSRAGVPLCCLNCIALRGSGASPDSPHWRLACLQEGLPTSTPSQQVRVQKGAEWPEQSQAKSNLNSKTSGTSKYSRVFHHSDSDSWTIRAERASPAPFLNPLHTRQCVSRGVPSELASSHPSLAALKGCQEVLHLLVLWSLLSLPPVGRRTGGSKG